ncbi:MAG: PLP-dependent aminotransferase family protein [Firmicutes bacterium]|nr:PLP-dependent aminotransferase family protein [Bacillota bacterium]
MKYHIDEKNTKPAYLQLYEQLRSDIVGGVLVYGSKLPSKRIMAEESGVSVITVQHSYAILCDEGYVESRQRSGYYVIYKESDFISAPDIVSITMTPTIITEHFPSKQSVKTDFPFSVLAKTMRRVLLDYSDNVLIKSPNQGCLELRHAISAYLARSNGMQVRPEQIIIGAGSEYLYSLLLQLLGKNRIFALEDPSYTKIRQVYQANGITCDMLKMGTSGIKTAELTRTKASVLHVTPFNSYPSGVTASVSKRHEYLRWAERRDGYIIEDNYASELTISMKHEDTVFSMSKHGSVIYLNTFSETIAPSIRVGYMVLPEKLLADFETKLGFYSCTVPVFEQYVLAELLSSGDFERHINRVRRKRRKTK